MAEKAKYNGNYEVFSFEILKAINNFGKVSIKIDAYVCYLHDHNELAYLINALYYSHLNS